MKQLNMIRWFIGTAFLVGALSFGTLGLVAASQQGRVSDDEHDDHRDEQHRIRQEVDEDNLIPLEQILEKHQDRITGRILDLEVEREHGKIIYELEYMGQDGIIREVHIDAANGDWLKEEIED